MAKPKANPKTNPSKLQLPANLKHAARKLRKLRDNQAYSTYEEALAQCRRVELSAAEAS